MAIEGARMTVVLTTTTKNYIGLSTDTKPTNAQTVAGSTFYETDTGQTAIYDGVAWQTQTATSQRRITVGNYNFTDDTGAQAAYTIFTITGDVLMQTFGICDVALTSGGAATIELGVAGNTAILIAQTTATALIANEIWHDATPTTTVEQLDVMGSREFVIANGQDAILTIGGADLTAGDIDFYALWTPLSADGLVVAA
jgi:hypothetical protein